MSAYKFDGNKTLNLECPNCGHGFTKTLGELRTGGQFDCPRCEVVFDASGFGTGVKAAEQELEQFRRNIRRMFGR